MSGAPTQGHDAAGGPERPCCLLVFPFVKRGWGAGASLVRHRKGRSTCGVQSAQAHVSLQTRSLGSPGSGSALSGPWGSGSQRPAVRPRRHHLLPFPWEPRVRPPGGGGRAGLRQTRGVGRGRGRGRASSSPSVLSGEGHDACRGVTDSMPSLPFSWLSPRASWLVTRSLTSEPLWVPGSRCPVRLVCRVSCPQVLSKRVWGPLRPQNTAVASASLC